MLTKSRDKIFDTNYTKIVRQGWFPVINWSIVEKPDTRWWLDRIVDYFVKVRRTDGVTVQESKKSLLADKSLEEQLQKIILIEDEKYTDTLLTPQLRKYLVTLEQEYVQTMRDYKSHLAPSYREMKSSSFNISWVVARSYYASSYPSYIDFLWTKDILWFYAKRDMSRYIYPTENSAIQSMMKRRSTQLKAEIGVARQKGITYDSDIDIEFHDVEDIRQKLATREERYFEASYYLTVYEHDEEKLRELSKKIEQKISGYGIRIKPASQRMDEAQIASLPLCIDELDIPRSMITNSLSWSFPFISWDLIEPTGILYGANLHTGSLVIFDRFAHKLPNANSIILATSGAGKSFATKLEILRYLMLGIEVIVIDPENEYKSLCEKVDGTYLNISINAPYHINPFDLPPKLEDVEYSNGDLLRSQILNLIGLISVLIGGVDAAEEAILDKALQATYSLKEITFTDDDCTGKTIPTMSDLLNVLEWMNGGDLMALKLSKYVTGTFANLFNNETNVDLENNLTVFSIRDIEDALKTPAMYNVLNYIWTKVRAHKKPRLLVIDEAWIMMQSKVAANFLFQLVKRARKFWLWVTTITQDVEDFLRSEYGKPIVSNASLQLLLRQSTSSIAALEKTFWLSEAEKQLLVSANIGEWLMVAGNQHVGVKILASASEKEFITTDINR
jgi:conjugal transfer ATP-binding protein TraC